MPVRRRQWRPTDCAAGTKDAEGSGRTSRAIGRSASVRWSGRGRDGTPASAPWRRPALKRAPLDPAQSRPGGGPVGFPKPIDVAPRPAAAKFQERVMTTYKEFHRQSIADRDTFWRVGGALVDWETPFSAVLDYSKPPFAKWFVGGRTNLCYNAVDRHLATRGGQKALVY